MKSIKDDLGRVDERSLLTSSGETGGSVERVTPLKIGFDREGERNIDVSRAEIYCFQYAIFEKLLQSLTFSFSMEVGGRSAECSSSLTAAQRDLESEHALIPRLL